MAEKLCNLRKRGGGHSGEIDITDYLSQSQGQAANTITCKIGDIFLGNIIGSPSVPTGTTDVTNQFSIITHGIASLSTVRIYKATSTTVTFPVQATGNAYANIFRITT